MLTADLIRSLAPRARQDYVDALVSGGDVLERAAINTPMRLAQFMANVSHECGGFTIIRENMNYTAARIKQVWPTRPEAVKFAGKPRELANAVYNGRMGNRVGTDDGWNFRGANFLQTTGRDNFERLGRELGIPLAEHPDLMDDPKIGLQAACYEFGKLVHLCDRGDAGFRAVCNGINRGNIASRLDPIGWIDRQRWLKRWTDALSASVVVDDTLELGDHGPLVTAFQERLTALGYVVGRVDGIFGSRMRAAVLAFQAENHLKTDGIIGAQTRKVLNSESAVSMPVGDRATETADDLKAAGSETVELAQTIKTVGKGLMGTGTAGGAADVTAAPSPPPAADLIAQTKDVVTEISSWKVIVNAIGETYAFATSHWWVFAIVIGFALHRWGGKIEWRRVLDHQLGRNLSR
jgi:predicted chitinase